MHFNKNLLSAALLASSVMGASFCATAAVVPEGVKLATKQELVRGNGTEVASLDPQKTEGVPESHVIRDLLEGLVNQDAAGNTIPGVAERWETPDNKTFTFHLRKNAKWSNGDSVTAHDFVYSFQRAVDPATASPYSWYLDMTTMVNASDIIAGKKDKSTLGVKAVDDYIPEPAREIDKPFLMAIEDVFSIAGRGTVATGRIERGVVKINEEIEIVGLHESKKVVVTGIEMFRKELDSALAGDNAGILLRGIDKDEIERGMVLAKPGSITPHKKFKAQVYALKKEEGGRHTPFFGGYKPQFYFRTTDVTGSIGLPEGVEMVMPGDNAEMIVELIQPVAIEKELRFAIREGGRTVGAGVVSEVVE